MEQWLRESVLAQRCPPQYSPSALVAGLVGCRFSSLSPVAVRRRNEMANIPARHRTVAIDQPVYWQEGPAARGRPAPAATVCQTPRWLHRCPRGRSRWWLAGWMRAVGDQPTNSGTTTKSAPCSTGRTPTSPSPAGPNQRGSKTRRWRPGCPDVFGFGSTSRSGPRRDGSSINRPWVCSQPSPDDLSGFFPTLSRAATTRAS